MSYVKKKDESTFWFVVPEVDINKYSIRIVY